MYIFQWKTKFKRDIKRVQKRGWDIEKLEKAFHHLSKDGFLPEDYRAHPLRGTYENCIDAHIESDWVLIYEIDEDEQVIILHRTGTHQDVFKNY